MHETAADRVESRRRFFRTIYGNNKGLVAFAFFARGVTRQMRHYYWSFPEQLDEACAMVEKQLADADVYYCPQFLRTPELKKSNIASCPNVWADLDECDPENLLQKPTAVVESSPGRYQALWVFAEPVAPELGEQISKRIAYAHAEQGADKSGWDLTQLLRVPETFNHKVEYVTQLGPPTVRVIAGRAGYFRPTDFDMYGAVETESHELIPYPEEFPSDTSEAIVARYKNKFHANITPLLTQIPDKDWSGQLWKLLMSCFEAGMSREEAFIVAETAPCNKYNRTGSRPEALWRDVCRAAEAQEKQDNPIILSSSLQPILTPEEKEHVQHVETFVERYVKWASDLGDAATQYHQAGAFVILSALLAGRVRLPTSFGHIIPNLWFMILGDTTLTRKSTAMDLAVDLLGEVEDDAIMATDGSLEGLLQALSMRPGTPSIFLRDEFSGLLEMMAKRDYYAGMAEMLTKLYDGKLQKRLLRKETIEVREPILITFAGGIRTRVQQFLKLDHVSSGFVPRFVFITAVSDVDKIKPLGPPTLLDTSGRETLLDELGDIKVHYGQQTTFTPPVGEPVLIPRKWDAQLTDEAWDRYRKFEHQMLTDGLNSDRPDLMTPVYSRLAVSTLKAIILLAACRQKKDYVDIELDDVLLGLRYCEEWRDYAVEVINGIGKGVVETQIERLYDNITRNPGVSRGTLMQHHHLTAREADIIFATLEQRGVVVAQRKGKGTNYFVVKDKK